MHPIASIHTAARRSFGAVDTPREAARPDDEREDGRGAATEQQPEETVAGRAGVGYAGEVADRDAGKDIRELLRGAKRRRGEPLCFAMVKSLLRNHFTQQMCASLKDPPWGRRSARRQRGSGGAPRPRRRRAGLSWRWART